MKLEHRLSALLQLHLHSQLNTWLQWIGQRQLQDETRNIYVLGLGASYIRELTVLWILHETIKSEEQIKHHNIDEVVQFRSNPCALAV